MMYSTLIKMRQWRLYQRVFLLNAAIFIVATLVLVVTPATISFPVELTEAIVLVAGLTAILMVNALALRAAFAPLDRLMRLMADVDPHRPGARLETTGPQEVRELAVAFNDMLDRIEDERRESARRELNAQESERRRVAQELHDEVGQVLTGVLLRLEAVALHSDAEQVELVRSAQDAIRNSIDHLSRLIRELRPEALTDLGLRRALAALASRVEDESGLRIRYQVAGGELEHLDDERELVIYRVAQESLTNVARHAQANAAELSITSTEDVVVLRIRDDGIGLESTQRARHGILGMRERALLVGATFTVENRASGGVQVTLTVPRSR
jgi:two-component system, NarL family, sensor histidine kinase UhpB